MLCSEPSRKPPFNKLFESTREDAHGSTMTLVARGGTAVIRSLVISVAALFGYRRTGRDWAKRLPKLNGRFRRSAVEIFNRLFLVSIALGCVASITFVDLSKTRPSDLRDPFVLSMMAVLIALCGYVIWPLGQSYLFKNGTLSCVWWTGRVAWCEDLSGLEYVTCSGGGGFTYMLLKWPTRRRRIELLGSLSAALSNPVSAADTALKSDERGTREP
jgi:hypothetical protein